MSFFLCVEVLWPNQPNGVMSLPYLLLMKSYVSPLFIADLGMSLPYLLLMRLNFLPSLLLMVPYVSPLFIVNEALYLSLIYC